MTNNRETRIAATKAIFETMGLAEKCKDTQYESDVFAIVEHQFVVYERLVKDDGA